MDGPARIKPLEASVVNRIAAGEIIIGPSNALKEILENSIDAQSTAIDILVKEGGLKLLQITDNGTGIDKEDLPILCERFTTSKLKKFEDLNAIATYGFRGEALASISHIAHLSVTTKTKQSACAWRAAYVDGAMVPLKPSTSIEPKAVAGKDGTQITVENLFYNVPSRLRAIKSANEELGKIVDIVGRYAVHTQGVGFTCKKMGDSISALTTRGGASRKERIRTVFGSTVANNLVEIDIESKEDIGLLKCFGQVTNSNYVNNKVIQPVFFINNRLVSCDPLKRAINALYGVFLPKGSKPFAYLSLEIDPANVDVNVHPTKREVRFLHEEEIIEYVVSKLQENLVTLDSSRTFLTQQVLPNARKLRDAEDEIRFTKSSDNNRAKVYDYSLVRTDASQAKITSFVSREQPKRKASVLDSEDGDDEIMDESFVAKDDDIRSRKIKVPGIDQLSEKEEVDDERELKEERISDRYEQVEDISEVVIEEDGESEGHNEEALVEEQKLFVSEPILKEPMDEAPAPNDGNPRETVSKRERVTVKLASVLSLRQEVESNIHKELTEIFVNHTFVGIVDSERRLAAIQYDVKLYLVDYAAVCFELFYQIGLSDFGNFGRIHLNDSGLSLKKLLKPVYNNDEFMSQYKGSAKPIEEVLKILVGFKEMLNEYFSIEINDEDIEDPKLVCIPLLLKGFIPSMNKLGIFLFRLGNRVEWSVEKDCFEAILKQISLYYIPESTKGVASEESNQVFENVLFPTFKRRLLATKNLSKDVVEIANLPGLYRVFERC